MILLITGGISGGQGFVAGLGSEPDRGHADEAHEGDCGAGAGVAAGLREVSGLDGADHCEGAARVVAEVLSGGADASWEQLGQVERQPSEEGGRDASPGL